MISEVLPGATVFTHSGKSAIVERLEGDRIVVRVSDGLKRIPIEVVARWELQVVPKVPAVGDRVKLKNTKLKYVITKIYDHFVGLQDGKPSYEQWAKLQTNDGKPAQWKLNQLEAIQ